MEMLAIEEVVIHPRVIDKWRARGREKCLIRREKKKKDSLAFFLPIKTCAPPTERWEKTGDKSVPWLFAGLQVVAVADVLFRGGGEGGGRVLAYKS